jgi:hypothetical protein
VGALVAAFEFVAVRVGYVGVDSVEVHGDGSVSIVDLERLVRAGGARGTGRRLQSRPW